MKKSLVACACLLGVVALLSVGPVMGQIKKGKTRPMTTEQLMEGLVAPHCKALGAGLKSEPADAKAWKHLAINAALLNESSHILMADGRCPDGVWAGATKTLGGCSAAVLEKIEAKDHAGAKEAFTALTKACGACHKAHKK